MSDWHAVPENTDNTLHLPSDHLPYRIHRRQKAI
jgi:hypothetical protein